MRPVVALLAVAVAAAPLRAQGAGFCRDSVAPPGAPARDLYCIDLSAAPSVRGARAVLELGPAGTPFGVAAAADGRMRHHLSLFASGLPAPSSLGPYGAWVAWVADPALDPVIRLGAVTNGTTDLGEVALDRFLVLVTAEPADTGAMFTGPRVLQGLSASTRMGAHGIVTGPAANDSDGHDHAHGESSGGWRVPSMRFPLPMPPMAHVMVPSTAPWLPADSMAPWARPRQLLELASGDSLVLEAAPVRKRVGGRAVTLYGFNGQVPGPLLAVRESTTVVVQFVNRTHLPTAIHWHGLRQDNAMDGVPHLTQEPVPPGGSFRYEIHFPDPGLYWYHPHHREDLLQDAGLAGNLLVHPADPDWLGPVHRDEVLMLDDLLMDEAGLLPWGRDAATHALMGRFGNELLVNGEPAWHAEARPGEVMRLWFTNVSNVRTWNLSLPGARMKVVASDLGRFEREQWVDNVVIAPAERYVVDVRFSATGTVPLLNRMQVLDHVGGRIVAAEDTLGLVSVAGAPASPVLDSAFAVLRRPAGAVEDAASLRARLAGPPDRELVLSLATDSLPFVLQRMFRLDTSYVHPVEWEGTMPAMDLVPTTNEVRWILRDPSSGAENEAITWRARVGERVRLRLRNDRSVIHPMAHPIHLHGQRFVVLARNGVPVENLVWKDTALVPVGGTVDLLVEFTNPGKWMLHCHIAEHLSAGMAMVVVVD